MRLTSPSAPCGRPGLTDGLTDDRAAMDYLPIFLQLRSARVLIVGGGRIAARKADLLQRAGAHVTVVAPRLHADLSSRSAAGELTHLAATFVPEHLDGAVIAVAATGLRDVNEAVARAAR